MSPPRAAKRSAQAAETRDALIAAARELFGEQGYAATSIEEVVDRAKVTKGALYHHFADKENLFRAVYEQVQREVSDIAVAEFLLPDSWEAVVGGCRLWIEAHDDPAIRQIALIDARVVLGWQTAREIETRFSTVALRGALRKAMHAGVVTRQPLRPLSVMLIGALTEACLYVASAHDHDQAREEVADLVLTVLSGIRAAEPEEERRRA